MRNLTQKSHYWDDYIDKQKNLYNIDLLKDADAMFESFTKSIGAWEPNYEIWDDFNFYVITLNLKNYGINNLKLEVNNKNLRVIGTKEGLKFEIKWILPPNVDRKNIVAKELSDCIEISLPILQLPKMINSVEKFLKDMLPPF